MLHFPISNRSLHDDETPRLYALRGATTVERDTSDDIAERTAELLGVRSSTATTSTSTTSSA